MPAKKNDRGAFCQVFVRADGSSVMQKRGDLTDREANIISRYIEENYLDMYKTWKDFGGGDFFCG